MPIKFIVIPQNLCSDIINVVTICEMCCGVFGFFWETGEIVLRKILREGRQQ